MEKEKELNKELIDKVDKSMTIHDNIVVLGIVMKAITNITNFKDAALTDEAVGYLFRNTLEEFKEIDYIRDTFNNCLKYKSLVKALGFRPIKINDYTTFYIIPNWFVPYLNEGVKVANLTNTDGIINVSGFDYNKDLDINNITLGVVL